MMLKWRKVIRQGVLLPLNAKGRPSNNGPLETNTNMAPRLRLHKESRPSGMWRRIDISNFRSIEHASITLAPFTVIVGPNGSGKSNFADALVFARDVALDASAAVSSRGGIAGVRRWRRTKPTDVTIDVRAARTIAALDRTYVRHLFRIHSGRQGDWSFSKETIEVMEDHTPKESLQRKGSTITGSNALPAAPATTASVMLAAKQFKQFAPTAALRNVRRYRLSPDAMRQPQLSVEETRLRENGDNIAASIQSIRAAGNIKDITQPMAKIVPGLEDIYVDQVGRYIALKFKQSQEEDAVAEFNATEMSEGALRALGIIVAAHQMTSDELLIIEEPEVSIHIGAANLLFDLLKGASARGAVLVTTHSADLLDAARDEEILVCEYKEGSTHIGPLSKAQREVVKQGLFSVAELMRSEPLRIEKGHEKG